MFKTLMRIGADQKGTERDLKSDGFYGERSTEFSRSAVSSRASPGSLASEKIREFESEKSTSQMRATGSDLFEGNTEQREPKLGESGSEEPLREQVRHFLEVFERNKREWD